MSTVHVETVPMTVVAIRILVKTVSMIALDAAFYIQRNISRTETEYGYIQYLQNCTTLDLPISTPSSFTTGIPSRNSLVYTSHDKHCSQNNHTCHTFA